ncbi:hypothetical protein LIT38_13060 [Bacillus sp. CMF12]|uniref:TetR family transcriptional regulator C-terminal domain-containing protein n=1 Tax=Bacillaceae TaxID=186817 RepID=UPI001FB364F0|nr:MULTISPECIES: TetR family transcriptional regulator C-terminal domain-containing protein [Bacillaceae]UOE53106.1 hypothetical protein IRB79_14355 [Cytobacillus oceanisediminis]USK52314.1 hypothetical protein LIT38_13060 [Bacillus sp. CMF12]
MEDNVVDQNSNIKLAIECWNYYNKNLLNNINGLHVNALQSLSGKNIDRWVTGKVIIFNDIDEVKDSKEFNEHERTQIKKLYTATKDQNFSNKMLEMAVNKNEILVNSIFGQGLAGCKQSIYLPLHGGKNFLRFIDGNESFYIIQRFNITGMYFPTRNIFIDFKSGHSRNSNIQKHIEKLNREIVRLFDKILDFSLEKESISLYALLVSFFRPYHYFNDFLSSLHSFHYYLNHVVKKPEVFNKIPRIISLEDGMFYSIKSLYSLPCEEQVVDVNDVNEIVLENNGFIVLPSSNKHYPEQEKSELNNLLVKSSVESLLSDPKQAKKFNQLKKCFPILWFGICGERRSWDEKVKGVAKIVREVQKLYPNVGVVLDGLTSTEAQSEKKFRREYAIDDKRVAKKIIKRIGPQIPTFNLIGSTSTKKIAYASQVDFFLTSYSTDTMFVAHICGKHGVAHMNTLKGTGQHEHPFIYKIPNKYIKNIIDDGSKRKGTNVSYSMNPKSVCSIFIEELQNYLSKEHSLKA